MRATASATNALVKGTPSGSATAAKTAAAKGHAKDQAAATNALVTAGEERKRHRTAVKAAATRKRNAAKRRGLSPGIALCPAEAVAQCARLAGWSVTDVDVLEIFGRCADGPGSGFTIAAALRSASRYGFGGQQVLGSWGPVDVEDELPLPGGDGHVGHVRTDEAEGVFGSAGHALILGVDLPGPHALTVAPDGGWWSWGEPFDPAGWPQIVIEEAWAVSCL